ncbi:hypothetical protein [Paenibacillus jiagnxiensis]|uniref:hypothetical protein n=1 Tax=Paenibacillus jiagnxiensis TaxID=3228926 RepID=UPI0033B13578
MAFLSTFDYDEKFIFEERDDPVENLQGKMHKTFKGYNSYEIVDADTSFIYKLATIVTEKFHFTHINSITGPEQVFMDFEKGGNMITLGWDIWSGCFVMAHDNAGDKYIEELGKYLDTLPCFAKTQESGKLR